MQTARHYLQWRVCLKNAIARQDGISKLEIDFDKAIVSFEQELKPINWKEKE